MVFNVDLIYNEMQFLMQNNYYHIKSKKKRFNLAKKDLLNRLDNLLEDNKLSLIKEVEK